MYVEHNTLGFLLSEIKAPDQVKFNLSVPAEFDQVFLGAHNARNMNRAEGTVTGSHATFQENQVCSTLQKEWSLLLWRGNCSYSFQEKNRVFSSWKTMAMFHKDSLKGEQLQFLEDLHKTAYKLLNKGHLAFIYSGCS